MSPALAIKFFTTSATWVALASLVEGLQNTEFTSLVPHNISWAQALTLQQKSLIVAHKPQIYWFYHIPKLLTA